MSKSDETRDLSRFEPWSRRTFLKRSAGAAGLAVVAGPLLEACAPAGTGGPSASAQPSVQPIRGGHVTESQLTEVKFLNPVMTNANNDERIYSLLYEGLLAFNPDGSLTPRLAASMPKVSADGLTYTFDLRKDVKWTDGKPLTADDVVFTYNLMYRPDYKVVPSQYRGDLQAVLADIQAPDPYTIVMRTKALNAAFLNQHSRYYVLPKSVLGDVPAAAIATHQINRAPKVTSGPFTLKEWLPSDHMTFTRNETYYRGAPYLDTFVVKLTPDINSIINQMKTGEVDMSYGNAFARFDEIAAIPSMDTEFIVTSGGPRIWFNLDAAAPASKIFSSKVVRQALLYAADRQGIANAVLFKYGAVPDSTGTFPPQSWANNPKATPSYAFDKAKAESLLDADGWKRGTAGVREKSGLRLKFDLNTSADSNEWQQIAAILQETWKAIGADVTIRAPRFAELTTNALNREFDVLMTTAFWGANPDPDPAQGFHSRNAVKGSRNFSSYKNPQVDRLLEQAVATLDQAKRKDFYFQMQDILNDEVPGFATPFWKASWSHHKRVKNIAGQVGPYGQSRWFMSQVYVTDGK